MASEDDKCQALVKAEMRVSKAQDVRQETELIMKPYANWEEYLMPAPLSIAILGQLIFISAGQGDFSINKKPPPNGFKFISYPESFRACLCQVSNEGWHAFNEAHVNMDRIRLLTASIPERMKLIVQTLFQDVKVVNAILPGQLKSMKLLVKECTDLAVKVKDKYKNVISLIQELLEACINAKTGYEKEQEEVKTALNQAKIREETAQKNIKLAKKYHNKLKEQTEESFSQYKKAMDEVPSGWEAIGMTIVEGLGNTLIHNVNGFANVVQGKYAGSTGDGPSDGSGTLNSESQSPLSAMGICGISPMMLSYASGLKENVIKEDRINFENVYDKKTEEVKTDWVKKSFLDLKNKISKEEDCQPKEKALNICISGIYICEQLECMATTGLKEMVIKQERINSENVYDNKTKKIKTKRVKKTFVGLKRKLSKEEDCQPKKKALSICKSNAKSCEQLEHMATTGKTGKEEESDIIKKIEDFYQQAIAFDSYSKGILRAPSFTPKPPNMAKCQTGSTGGSVGVRNAHLKVEQSREMYKATQEEYQKSFENFKKQNEELAEILCLMEQCKVKEIDFEAALKMLKEGLKAMGKVKEQWEKMIRFFEMISSIIDTCLSQKIHDFLQFASDIQQIEGYSSMSYVKDTIYSHVFSASNVAHLVHMIAETYTEVSDKYLMDRISSLGRLLALERTDPEFNSERNALKQGCEEARKAIYDTVVEKKEEFDRNLVARMQTIDRELKAVLPPLSELEKKMIKKAVHDGRKELTAGEEDQFV